MKWQGITKISVSVGLLILLLSSQALAVPVVDLEVTPLSGGIFEYKYTLTNPAGSGESIYDFGIFGISFEWDTNNWDSPKGWDPLPGIGFFEWLSLDLSYDLVDDGVSLSGFLLKSPYEPGTIDFIAYGSGGGIFSGTTEGPVAPVPEPASLLLLGSGLAGIGLLRKRLLGPGIHC